MNVQQAINSRRSIRKFRSDQIERNILEQIINSATMAPSAKNRQPWFFTVVEQQANKIELLKCLRQGIARLQKENLKLNIFRPDIEQALETFESMSQAPVTIIVTCRNNSRVSNDDGVKWNLVMKDIEVVDIQSIGAALQNMTLTATSLGIGCLWNCDVLYAYPELSEWLGLKFPIIAAISLGYFDEVPNPRPRISIDEITEWK